MKKFSKVLSLVLVLAMVFALSATAFATTAEPGEFTHGTFNGSTAESTITATNVTAGDSVAYYQLVRWDTTATDWVLTDLGTTAGVSVEELKNGITEAEAAAIANALATATATGSMTPGDPTTTFTAEVAPGLYYLKATPAANNKTVIYNPAFVSADYYAGGNTVDFSSAIGSSTVLKKSDVPFDKKVDDASAIKYQDVKPGDTIPYKIETTIPSYGASFTNPVFTVEDTFSDGLELTGNVTVAYKVRNGDALQDATTTETVTDVVTITKKEGGKGFKVEFAKGYLQSLKAEAEVVITYSAEVTTAAPNNVNPLDNTAKLTYSNAPNSTTDKDDITRHYTFTIDGNLLGSSGTRTHELIKTACDAEGNIIYDETTTYYDGPVNALDGASFTLTPVAPTTGEAKTVSSADGGHIKFTGLDAGTYTLVENSAPQGYVKDSNTYTVQIVPHYTEGTAGTDAPILESYDVIFKNGETVLTTSSFTTTNDGTVVTTSAPAADGQYIGNTPGAELPSTGGIGTTIFYIVGAALVIGAGVVLVTRRRVQA